MLHADHLMTIVPLPDIRLHDRLIAHLVSERRPAMRRDEERVDEISIVAEQPPQPAPDRARRLVLQTEDVIHDGHDVVLAQEPHCLVCIVHPRAFAYPRERIVSDGLDAHQNVEKSGLFVEMQNVGVAHNVLRANRGAETHWQVSLRNLRQHALPYVFERGGILVREPEEAHIMLAVQPLKLVHEPDDVAMPPAPPEHPLSTVGAGVRAAARELHDSGPAKPEGAILIPIPDQIPADGPGVEVRDGRTRSIRYNLAAAAPGDAPHA